MPDMKELTMRALIFIQISRNRRVLLHHSAAACCAAFTAQHPPVGSVLFYSWGLHRSLALLLLWLVEIFMFLGGDRNRA